MAIGEYKTIKLQKVHILHIKLQIVLLSHRKTCYNLIVMDNKIDSGSLKILIYNLDKLRQRHSRAASYASLASEISVNLSTLKCWMSQQRAPTLKTIDKIANRLGCYAYQLLKPDGQTGNNGIFTNDSATAFTQNLQAIFNEQKKFSLAEKCALVNSDYKPDDNCITETMLTSYFRKNSRRIPSLKTLDYISRALKVEPYELLIPKTF